MPDLGRAALIVCLGLAAYAVVGGAIAARTQGRRLAESAENAILASFLGALVASGVLLTALLRHDFGFVYVWRHTSLELPRQYTVSAFWGGQEGSLLLWLLVLTGFSAAAVLLGRRSARSLLAWTVPVLGAVIVFFAFLLVAVASPFATQAAPVDGQGLNPSLQNPYMLAHPPLLYLGFVGLTIPFAFAMGALLARRTDEAWVVATRRWTLAAWTFLGFVVLVTGAFALSLFGTFLTRSGVINSIHSFTQSSIGAWFLAFIALVVAASVVLILTRMSHLRSPTRLESLVSREAAFLYNNLFLVALALTILWGVVFPLVSEAVRGVALTVGAPYYNFFAIAFGLPLVLLMGIGPLVAWRRASLRALGKSLAWPAGVALGVGSALALLGAGSSPAGLVGYTFGAFVLAAIVFEFARGTSARRSLAGESWPAAFTGLVGRNRRRYGGYVVHASIVLLAMGAAGIGGFGGAGGGKAAPRPAPCAGAYDLSYLSSGERRGANAIEARAQFRVERGGDDLGTVAAGKNRYLAEQQESSEVAIRSDWLRGEDLFVIVNQFNADGSVSVKTLVNPLVNLIWLAGLVFLLGSIVAMWPDAREQRRLARRFAYAPA